VALRLYLTTDAARTPPPTIRGTWSDKALTGASYRPDASPARHHGGEGRDLELGVVGLLMRRFVQRPVNNPMTCRVPSPSSPAGLEANAAANMTARITCT